MRAKRQGMGRTMGQVAGETAGRTRGWGLAGMVVAVAAACGGVMVVGGCSGGKDVLPEGERELAAAEMAGTWVVASIGGVEVRGEHAPTVDLWGDGKVSGSTGVNRFSSKVTILSPAGGRIKFDPIAMTKRAGPPELMEVESKFGKALDSSNKARVKGESLVFWKDEAETLVLRKKGN